ncbi:hypothetical protein K435DRAFT_793993 [Dendrothele bispora CBS 962.96]|uniref:Uncharacterized protein n=1 Tax=Dendrothele bispora (strain CBS 962.96) TaxID=1314807 RepID=A0A4S8MDL5_DENBC|nr:hypothetical protein K435DRAFT_793993 [Dendrothele bispora CBS 962.96]
MHSPVPEEVLSSSTSTFLKGDVDMDDDVLLLIHLIGTLMQIRIPLGIGTQLKSRVKRRLKDDSVEVNEDDDADSDGEDNHEAEEDDDDDLEPNLNHSLPSNQLMGDRNKRNALLLGERPLAQCERKKLGLPKCRVAAAQPTRHWQHTGNAGGAVGNGDGGQWWASETGRVDVRGFRELEVQFRLGFHHNVDIIKPFFASTHLTIHHQPANTVSLASLHPKPTPQVAFPTHRDQKTDFCRGSTTLLKAERRYNQKLLDDISNSSFTSAAIVINQYPTNTLCLHPKLAPEVAHLHQITPTILTATTTTNPSNEMPFQDVPQLNKKSNEQLWREWMDLMEALWKLWVAVNECRVRFMATMSKRRVDSMVKGTATERKTDIDRWYSVPQDTKITTRHENVYSPSYFYIHAGSVSLKSSDDDDKSGILTYSSALYSSTIYISTRNRNLTVDLPVEDDYFKGQMYLGILLNGVWTQGLRVGEGELVQMLT